jgi:hypothetical protein
MQSRTPDKSVDLRSSHGLSVPRAKTLLMNGFADIRVAH